MLNLKWKELDHLDKAVLVTTCSKVYWFPVPDDISTHLKIDSIDFFFPKFKSIITNSMKVILQ